MTAIGKKSFLAGVLLVLPASLFGGATMVRDSYDRFGVHVSYSSGKVLYSSLGQIVIGRSQEVLESQDPRLRRGGEELGIEVDQDLPETRYRLESNFPNPFNPTTTIRFSLGETARVRLRIYDVAGRLVRILVDETKSAGEIHTALWDGRDDAGEAVSSGIYFCELVTRNFTETRKMVLLK